MLSTLKPKSTVVHRLARFVTKKAIALLLKIKPEQIDKIDRWPYVLHVVGLGLSRFVSYADLPPIIGVAPPSKKDFTRWYKRWNKRQAPDFWAGFFEQQYRESAFVDQLTKWSKLVDLIRAVLAEADVQKLQEIAQKVKSQLESQQRGLAAFIQLTLWY